MKFVKVLAISTLFLAVGAVKAAPRGVVARVGYEQRGTDSTGQSCAMLYMVKKTKTYPWKSITYPDTFSSMGITGPSLDFDGAGRPRYDFGRRVVWYDFVREAVSGPMVIGGMQIQPGSGADNTKLLAKGGWSTEFNRYRPMPARAFTMTFHQNGYGKRISMNSPSQIVCHLGSSAFEAYREDAKGRILWQAPNSMFKWFRR